MYKLYKNTKGKREIVMHENKIIYLNDDKKLTEINFNEITHINLSYQYFYHISQDRLNPWYLLLIFFMGWLITKSFIINITIFLVCFLVLFIGGQFIKIILMEKYSFYHSILLHSKQKIINIPLIKEKKKEEVIEYFHKKGIKINQQSKYFKPFYGVENINN